MVKLIKQEVTITQGVVGDMAMANLAYLSQEEIQQFWKDHIENVKKLKAEGQYLKPKTIVVWIEEAPLLDAVYVTGIDPYDGNKATESVGISLWNPNTGEIIK